MCSKRLLAILLVSIIAILTIQTIEVVTVPPPKARVVKYAEIIKYPLLSTPEPVLIGDSLKVIVKASKDCKDWKATIINKYYGDYNLEFLSSTYDEVKGLWTLYFKLPDNVRKGLYDLRLEFSEKNQKKSYYEPHSVWILDKWPKKLRVIVFGDTKTPTGAPYFYEAIRTINLLNPDFAIFLGDLVERPIFASAWKYFLGIYLQLERPCYIVIGNHEYEHDFTASIYEKIIGPQNYTIRIGDFLLIVLPTGSEGWIPMKYLKWAENILAHTNATFKILAFHHPLFSPYMKGKVNYVLKLKDVNDFKKFIEEHPNYLYPSWNQHKEEAFYLFDLIIKYDVRLILYEHIHTDLNVIVEDSLGKKHYFICPAAVAYDVRLHDIRGFKYLVIYSNGTVDESTLYYNGTGLFTYPNSIPIDLGEGNEPYKIGTIEYYYAPANDGKHYAVSFRAKNDLNQYFYNISIVFKLPIDKPLSAYKWYPYKPKIKVIRTKDYYYVFLENITLPAKSVIKFTVASIDDKTPPIISISNISFLDKWCLINVSATDSGWGVDNVTVLYSIDGGKTWKSPALLDLVDPGLETITYTVWIPLSKGQFENVGELIIKVIAKDFKGNTASLMKKFKAGVRIPKLVLNVTLTPSIEVNKYANVSILLENKGNGTAYGINILVKVKGVVTLTKSFYIGILSPGEKVVKTISFTSKTEGKCEINITVTSVNCKPLVTSVSTQFIKPPVKAQPSYLSIFNVAIITVVIIVVLIVTIWLLLRKRKSSH